MKTGGKKTWAAILGALDPFFKRMAQDLAKKTPKSSFLRSGTIESVQGVLKSVIEESDFVKKAPAPVSAFIEKFTDFGDFFQGALGLKKEEKKAAVEDWMNRFFIDAGKRLSKATDVQTEFDKIKIEFELRCELLNLIESKLKPADDKQQAQVDEINWQEEWKKFIKKFHEFSDGLIEFGKEFNKEFQISEGITKADQAVAQRLKGFRNFLSERGIR